MMSTDSSVSGIGQTMSPDVRGDGIIEGAPNRDVAGQTGDAAVSAERPDAGGQPRTLLIPRLGVQASVEPVGVTSDGATEVPQDARRVGWYRFGPSPGSVEGSAVIVGHVDSRTQGLGVLAELARVQQGDRVEVRSAEGVATFYRIVSRRTVPKQDLAASDAFRRTGPPVLTLVTCAGAYVKEQGGYQDNLVVTALPES